MANYYCDIHIQMCTVVWSEMLWKEKGINLCQCWWRLWPNAHAYDIMSSKIFQGGTCVGCQFEIFYINAFEPFIIWLWSGGGPRGHSHAWKVLKVVSIIVLGPGGGVLPYLGMVGRFRGDEPRFWDFQSDWEPFSASSNPSNSQARSDWPLIVLIFNPIDPLFPKFQSNWPPFLNPVRSDWVHFSGLC